VYLSGLKGSSRHIIDVVLHFPVSFYGKHIIMDKVQLNLARKWRSQQFDQIIGQDLSVRILKNSLFLGKIFPVYLFSGQHGCGKTTTARVFAAAVNCKGLSDFQQNPKKFTVPCLHCDSCKAMIGGKHPDFIEMDAASHTGVDNVRQIIEASTLLPLMGRKKIYLIDEAHMLSKAAFNAFLKILEEPPESVFFILATTDEHKIIDTVRSRCFQLFFNAVERSTLRNHLAHICEEESIICEPEGLELIIKETGGSVRDALNLLEQVCFSAKRVGKLEVLQVLGYLPEEQLVELFVHILTANSIETVVRYMQQINCAEYNADYMWKRFLQLLHVTIWLKCNTVPDDFWGDIDQLRSVIKSLPLSLLTTLFEFFCRQEPIFLKTVHKQTFLQLFFVQAWQLANQNQFKEQVIKKPIKLETINETRSGLKVEESIEVKKSVVSVEKKVEPDITQTPWDKFLKKMDALEEPLLSSLFKQARFEKIDEGKVKVCFAHRLRLFNDTLEQMREKWQPVLSVFFGNNAQLEASFREDADGDVKKKSLAPQIKLVQRERVSLNRRMGFRCIKIDVSDKNRWPLTHKLLNYFPGTVVQLPEQKNEKVNE